MLTTALVLGCTRASPQPPATGMSPAAPTRSGSSACAPLRASGASPLIDDFEAEPGRLLANEGRGGFWFGYDDGSRGTLAREEVALDGAADDHGRALRVVASGFTVWGAAFGASLHPASIPTRACAYDASTYTGLRLRARGRGRLRVSLADSRSTPTSRGGTCIRPDKGCYDQPGLWLDLGAAWQVYDLPFCAFVPEGWGGEREGVDPARLFDLHFRVGAHESVELWLDDLAFYRAEAGATLPRCGPRCPLDAAPRSARIDPSFSTSPLGEGLSLHTFEQETTSCGALLRRYLSYVPPGMAPRSSAPVLILLHGSGANAESARTFQARDRFDALAARDGFIVLYGNAAPGSETSPDPGFPNTGAWRQAFSDDGQVDDVDYLTRMLGDLEARGVIAGDNPVFLTGISNGGGLVLAAARRIPDRLRGIAAITPFDGAWPQPVPDVSGTGLRRVLFAYSIGDPGMAEGYHRTLAPLPARWGAAMGLPRAALDAPRRTPLPDTLVEGTGYRGTNAVALATRDSRVTQLDMASADGDRRVRVLVMDRAGHFWPNPVPDTEEWVLHRWGFRNQDFDAADATWAFLRTAL